MITTEFLNAVPGRPDFMQPWAVLDDIAEERRFVCEVNDEGWGPGISLYLSVCCPKPHLDLDSCKLGTQWLLPLAIYARRVELEIERAMAPKVWFVGDSCYSSRHDAIDAALDGVFDDDEVVEVEIAEGDTCKPEDYFSVDHAIDSIAESIACEIGTDCDGEACEINWRPGHREALNAFVARHVKASWHFPREPERIRVKVKRDDDGDIVGWEEIEAAT